MRRGRRGARRHHGSGDEGRPPFLGMRKDKPRRRQGGSRNAPCYAAGKDDVILVVENRVRIVSRLVGMVLVVLIQEDCVRRDVRCRPRERVPNVLLCGQVERDMQPACGDSDDEEKEPRDSSRIGRHAVEVAPAAVWQLCLHPTAPIRETISAEGRVSAGGAKSSDASAGRQGGCLPCAGWGPRSDPDQAAPAHASPRFAGTARSWFARCFFQAPRHSGASSLRARTMTRRPGISVHRTMDSPTSCSSALSRLEKWESSSDRLPRGFESRQAR